MDAAVLQNIFTSIEKFITSIFSGNNIEVYVSFALENSD